MKNIILILFLLVLSCAKKIEEENPIIVLSSRTSDQVNLIFQYSTNGLDWQTATTHLSFFITNIDPAFYKKNIKMSYIK